MNFITIDDLPVYDPPEGGRQTNEFTTYTSASRYGTGRYLMRRSDYDSLAETVSDSDGVATLVMSSRLAVGSDAETVVVSFPVIIAGCVPYSVSVDAVTTGDNTAKDFVEVYVYDLRFFLQRKLVDKAINVQKPGFESFYPSTLASGTTERDWANVVTLLEIDGIFTVGSYPTTWKPRNLVFDQVPIAKVVDCIAETIRRVVGVDLELLTPFATTGLTEYSPGSPDAYTTEELANTEKYKISGRESVRATKKMPGKYRVVFKVFDATTNSSDPYTSSYGSRYYTKDITGDGPNSSNIFVIHVGEYVGLITSSAVFNQTELDAVASDIALRTQAFQSTTPDEATYAGWHPFITDGVIRAVRWWSTRDGCFTTIRMNSDRDFFVADEVKRTIDALSNQLVVSLGPQQSSMTLAGTRIIWPVNRSSALLTPLTTIGQSTEGSESADTSSWFRGTSAVEEWAVSRVVYNDAGDHALYAFLRKKTYDISGDLYSIGPEVRVTVDTTEKCS